MAGTLLFALFVACSLAGTLVVYTFVEAETANPTELDRAEAERLVRNDTGDENGDRPR
ncbi:hypothetical protein [Haloarchaeobius sp. TZWWS8]|uniref:hypothetical protein n=1 Tax=Haloarchaeobius sp. TZWWS8 TaxID=3446121 RepID=UPI003EC153CC